MLPASREKVHIYHNNVYFQAQNYQKYTVFPLKTLSLQRGPSEGLSTHRLKPDISCHFWALNPRKPSFFPSENAEKKHLFFSSRMTAPDRRRYPPIFGDFAPTSSSRKKHSPPLVALGGGGRGGRGVRAAGRLGLAGGSGGWLVAGRRGPGVVWRHGAWWHGCMEGNDRFRWLACSDFRRRM